MLIGVHSHASEQQPMKLSNPSSKATLLTTFSSAVLALCLGACDSSDEEAQSDLGDDEQLAEPDELAAVEDANAVGNENDNLIAEVSVENGPTLTFVAIGDGDVGIMEVTAPGVPELADMMDLDGADALQIFWAVTDDDTEIPDEILDSSPVDPTTERGWIADDIEAGDFVKSRGNCTDSEFTAIMNSFLYNDRSTPKIRLNKKPGTSSYFIGNSNAKRYSADGAWSGSYFYNVDRYYSRVAACTLVSRSGSWTGPVISFRYRAPSGSWHDAWVGQLKYWEDEGKAYAWHMFTGTSSKNYDWWTGINYAMNNDKYDIGHAVEDL